MSEFTKPQNPKEWSENFEQIKPIMGATMAHQESSRCLFCYDAPCQKACPTSIDIPLFIRQIYTDNVTGAARTIYESNYFGNICGKVCPTEVLCEGACVHNHQNVPPIQIGRLQSFATTQAIEKNIQFFTAGAPIGKKVAVIGAGPAGIGAACELRRLGIEVDIFEAKSQPSGLALHGVAPYKIENESVLDEINYWQAQLGFNIIYNTPIQNAEELKALENKYDAIFLGIGLGKTKNLGLAGQDFKNCYGATEFIEKLKLDPFNTNIGKHVVVVGGGNTAMDAASECARMGAEQVTLVYRKSKAEMGAYDFEYELAKSVGVKGIFGYSPKAIEGDENGAVKSIVFTITNDNYKEYAIDCDMVILATGQEKQTNLLSLIEGLSFDKGGRVVVNEDFQATNPKYYAAGDAVNGGAEVVNAVGEAKKAAKAIYKNLMP